MYSKSLEAQERQTFERKQQLKDVLASGKKLPTELKKDAQKLGKDLAFDESQAGAQITSSFLASTHISNDPQTQHHISTMNIQERAYKTLKLL